MSQHTAVYDIGEVGLTDAGAEPWGKRTPYRPGARSRTRHMARRAGPGPGLTGSLSLFVPGLGQMLGGAIGKGVFFLTGIGFSVAVTSALIRTLDSLLPTLDL